MIVSDKKHVLLQQSYSIKTHPGVSTPQRRIIIEPVECRFSRLHFNVGSNLILVQKFPRLWSSQPFRAMHHVMGKKLNVTVK